MNGDEQTVTAAGGSDAENPRLSAKAAARALERAVIEAGDLALTLFRAGVRTWTKENASPVTEADLAVDALLHERLGAIAPGYGWLSEESADARGRTGQRRLWVVDPIDGTRAFIKQLPDWTIVAALVEDGRPIASALYAPVTEELFVAAAGLGATRNGMGIVARPVQSLQGARVAGPRMNIEQLTRCGAAIVAVPRIHSLALRFARVASGEIDMALASCSSHDWDLAAADLLVHEANGTLTTFKGEQLVYNRKDNVHEALAAAEASAHSMLLAALNDAAGSKG